MSSRVPRDAGHRLPGGAVAFEVADERGVDDVVLERVQEDRGDEPAVLADLGQHRVARPGEEDVLEDAGRLRRLACPAEEELVDLGLPGAEPRARAGARRAAALAVAAVVGRVAVLELERPVDPVGVAVTEHVVRARDDAAGASRAEPRRDDLFVEVPPVQLLGRHRRESSIAISGKAYPGCVLALADAGT